MKPVNGQKRMHKGKKQVAGWRGEPKELTRGDCGSLMKFAFACRKVSRHATVAWCKRNIFKENLTQRTCAPWKEVTAARKITRSAGHRCEGWNKDDVMPRCLKRGTFGRRLWKGTGNFDMNFTKTARLEITKWMVISTAGLRTRMDWTLWRGRPPPKRKKGNGPYGKNR
jgi:hypothetical protein